MDNKKKLIAIIGGALVVIAIVILCVCLIPHGNDTTKPTTPTDSTETTKNPVTDIVDNRVPSDGTGPVISDSEEEKILKEYEKLKKRVENIYDFEPKKPFVYDDGKYKYTIKDVITLYETFPSTKLINKNSTGSPLKEELFEMKNNLKDFNHLLIEDTKPTINDGVIEYPYIYTSFPLNLPDYKYNEIEYPASSYENYMYENMKKIVLVETLFENEEDYYQACYDALVELINMVPKETLKTCFASLQQMYSFDSVYNSCEKGNYVALFDGIMNHRIVFAYKDNDNIIYRAEVGVVDTNQDGAAENCLNIKIVYQFDDESKFS